MSTRKVEHKVVVLEKDEANSNAIETSDDVITREDETLAELAAEGWELVAVLSGNEYLCYMRENGENIYTSGTRYFFKRVTYI